MTNNPMVEYIASLRTQNQGANPSYVQETRGAFLTQLREQAAGAFPEEADLHVRSGLDALVDAIVDGSSPWRLVVLTGDAGDGKTQACARLADAWGIQLDPVTEHGEWVILKDASELLPGQLAAALERWGEAPPPGRTRRLLIAINEGRLRTAADLFGSAWDDVVRPSLDGLLDSEGGERLEAASRRLSVLVLNFRHRLFVRAGVRGLLETWTAPSYWEGGACAGCERRDSCPILANAQDLRASDRVDGVADVLMWLHLAGQRLPFRRLQGILAFAFTGGLGCGAVQAPGATAIQLLRHRYYAAFFLSTGRETGLLERVQPEPAAAMLAALDSSSLADREHDESLLAAWRAEPPDRGPEGAIAMEGIAPELLLPALRQRSSLLSRSAAAPWRRALSLFEGGSGGLRELVVRSLNRINGHLDNSGALQPLLTDPEALVAFERRAVDLLLPAAVELRVRRCPAVPSMVRDCLDEIATVVEVVAESSTGQPALTVDIVLLERLIGVIDRGASVVSLGGYRTDIVRFLSRIVADVSAGVPSVVLRLGEHRLRLAVADKVLRLESV